MRKKIKLVQGKKTLASGTADISDPAAFRQAVNKLRAEAEKTYGDAAWYAEVQGGKPVRTALKPAVVRRASVLAHE